MFNINYIYHLYKIPDVFAENVVELNVLAYSVGGGTSIYSPMMNDFNEYAKKEGLNTSIHLVLFSLENSTAVITDYEAMIDSIFSRRSEKYDFIIYDNIFAPKYAKHLLDLKDIVPKETIDEYMEGVASQTCIIKDRLIGLVSIINIFFFNNSF